jgi:ribonucleoside-diphosphate reductase alpha chain
MAKEGSTIGGIMDSFGTALSIALQYGVPLEVLVNKFSHTRFEPMGHTSNKDIRIAKSVVDYISPQSIFCRTTDFQSVVKWRTTDF